MSSTDNQDNNEMNNKPKKVYPKEAWPRDVVLSDGENQDEIFVIDNEQENRVIYEVANSPNRVFPNPILKRDNDQNKDSRQSRAKSVVFNLSPVSNVDFNYNISKNDESSKNQNGNQTDSSSSDDSSNKMNDN
ncbi:Hypothetical protein SRAE_X000021400 [Strongyloides ratti]|uniref:Uncharacterized protein n=1 Tax=Strongyloides ratti TaxID=34506 RepID=A0A090LTD7_STRRB|nr:Hypothetical protein SRAE_X000021400 [Strongyloides ratti]CEF70884.1 Hypothetical protein SRAE_X000021400 [Strongyloides ratti]